MEIECIIYAHHSSLYSFSFLRFDNVSVVLFISLWFDSSNLSNSIAIAKEMLLVHGFFSFWKNEYFRFQIKPIGKDKLGKSQLGLCVITRDGKKMQIKTIKNAIKNANKMPKNANKKCK